jgi:hypothetical protein
VGGGEGGGFVACRDLRQCDTTHGEGLVEVLLNLHLQELVNWPQTISKLFADFQPPA